MVQDEVKTDKNGTAETAVEVVEKAVDTAILEEMTKVGILLGHRRSRTNPKMKKFIFTTRNGFEIIDLVQTIECIERAQEFLKEAKKTGKPILVVGTEPAAHEAVKALADKFNFPYVTERWLGGTLTNFEMLSQRIQYYTNLKNQQATGKLDKYTKKERTEIEKQIKRLTTLFGGLERLTTLPSALLVVNADSHAIAVKEANDTKVPVVAIANTSADPDFIDHLVPANDNNQQSIGYIFKKFEEALASVK